MLEVVLRNKRASCGMGGVKNKEYERVSVGSVIKMALKVVLKRGRNNIECAALVRGFHVGSGAAE